MKNPMGGIPYLMESPDEAGRLEAKTDAELARRLLVDAGLRPGMRALDAGAGTGAVARVMSSIVGPGGSVVAFDRSPSRLEHGRDTAEAAQVKNLVFETGDLEAAPPPAGPYDFIWCRFVFEYLRDADRALEHLVRATRVGGKVVVADLDGNAAFHHPSPPVVEEGLRRIFAHLEGTFDPYAGRKLFARFRRAGLADVKVRAEPYHLYAGTAPDEALPNWQQKLAAIRPRAVDALGGVSAYEEWAAAFMKMLRDPDSFTYSILVVVEGVRAR